MRKLDDFLLGSIELFCVAAELNSFSAAANSAGVTPAAVSRSIARLEQRLKVQLFTRNTRCVRLTCAGAIYAERCRQALSIVNDASRSIADQNISCSGTINVSMPTTYAHHRVLSKIGLFKSKYPNVELLLHVSNSDMNLIGDICDLSIRAGKNKDSNLVARKLEDAELVVVASQDYIKRHGEPLNIEELIDHECIQFIPPNSGKAAPWLFSINRKAIEVQTHGKISCTEEGLGGVTLAKGGAGIYQTYRFVVEQDLSSGSLVEILKPFGGRSRDFSILYPCNKYVSKSTRTFLDFLVTEVRKDTGTTYPIEKQLETIFS